MLPVERVRVQSSEGEERGPVLCALCRDALGARAPAAVACAGCGTRFHRACAAELGGCPTIGCGRADAAPRSRAASAEVGAADDGPGWLRAYDGRWRPRARPDRVRSRSRGVLDVARLAFDPRGFLAGAAVGVLVALWLGARGLPWPFWLGAVVGLGLLGAWGAPRSWRGYRGLRAGPAMPWWE